MMARLGYLTGAGAGVDLNTRLSLFFSRVLAPIPGTFSRSARSLNGPFALRYSTITAALAGPIPFKASARVCASALLMSTGAAKLAPENISRVANAAAMIPFFITLLLDYKLRVGEKRCSRASATQPEKGNQAHGEQRQGRWQRHGCEGSGARRDPLGTTISTVVITDDENSDGKWIAGFGNKIEITQRCGSCDRFRYRTPTRA